MSHPVRNLASLCFDEFAHRKEVTKFWAQFLYGLFADTGSPKHVVRVG